MKEAIFVIFICCVSALLGGICGNFFGFVYGVEASQNEAIAAKVAHWTINPQTGEKKFEFIKPKP